MCVNVLCFPTQPTRQRLRSTALQVQVRSNMPPECTLQVVTAHALACLQLCLLPAAVLLLFCPQCLWWERSVSVLLHSQCYYMVGRC